MGQLHRDHLSFAISYVKFLSGNGASADTRARAQHLASAIDYLDAVLPGWRDQAAEVIERMHAVENEVSALFELPAPDPAEVQRQVLATIRGAKSK